MTHRWHYEDASGATVDGPGVRFDDREQAEDWLGKHWSELLDAGIDQVTLMDSDRALYGPMSLQPPQP